MATVAVLAYRLVNFWLPDPRRRWVLPVTSTRVGSRLPTAHPRGAQRRIDATADARRPSRRHASEPARRSEYGASTAAPAR